MRQRIRKDVLPTAIAFLQRQSEISHKSLPVYKFSQMCKLQTKALNFIGTVVSQLKLTDEDFYKAASVCSVYLDCRQPQVLQEVSERSKILDQFQVYIENTVRGTRWLLQGKLTFFPKTQVVVPVYDKMASIIRN